MLRDKGCIEKKYFPPLPLRMRLMGKFDLAEHTISTAHVGRPAVLEYSGLRRRSTRICEKHASDVRSVCCPPPRSRLRVRCLSNYLRAVARHSAFTFIRSGPRSCGVVTERPWGRPHEPRPTRVFVKLTDYYYYGMAHAMITQPHTHTPCTRDNHRHLYVTLSILADLNTANPHDEQRARPRKRG